MELAHSLDFNIKSISSFNQ